MNRGYVSKTFYMEPSTEPYGCTHRYTQAHPLAAQKLLEQGSRTKRRSKKWIVLVQRRRALGVGEGARARACILSVSSKLDPSRHLKSSKEGADESDMSSRVRN
jgi:hypothetical protein